MLPPKMNLCFAILVALTGSASATVSMCYWGTWAAYFTTAAKFLVTDIDTSLCSHVVYSFIGLDYDGNLLLLDEEFDITNNGIADFIALKEDSPDVKLLVAMGGWNQGSANYSEVASNSTKRAKINAAIVEFLNKYGFDGFDLDWEYPNKDGADAGGRAVDYANFVTWLQELRAAFDAEGKGWLLTIAAAPLQSSIDSSYDVPAIDEVVDYINLMTYDFHGTWDGVTGVNAPLYQQTSDTSDAVTVSAGVEAWLASGVTPSKLLLGIGAYGKAFTLTSADDHETGDAITGAGSAGPLKGDTTTWSYQEISSTLVNETGWTVVNNNNSYVYTYKDLQWIGYDNPDTVYVKGQYAREKGLGGVMMWSLENDDFNGFSGGEKYPILRAAINGFEGGNTKSESSFIDVLILKIKTIFGTA